MSRQAYEAKFKGFIDLCTQSQAEGMDVIVIHHPEVLGDTYDEMVESLNRLAAAELKLAIVPPAQRQTRKR